MKALPLDDRIVVKLAEAATKTPGGIVLPDHAKERPQRGEVLAVGPGRPLDNGERFPMAVKIGDVVLFSVYGGTDVEIEGDTLKVMRESDVLAILK